MCVSSTVPLRVSILYVCVFVSVSECVCVCVCVCVWGSECVCPSIPLHYNITHTFLPRTLTWCVFTCSDWNSLSFTLHCYLFLFEMSGFIHVSPHTYTHTHTQLLPNRPQNVRNCRFLETATVTASGGESSFPRQPHKPRYTIRSHVTLVVL